MASIAQQVGIEDARGELLPEDKLAAVEALSEQYGCVGMVGLDAVRSTERIQMATSR